MNNIDYITSGCTFIEEPAVGSIHYCTKTQVTWLYNGESWVTFASSSMVDDLLITDDSLNDIRSRVTNFVLS